MHVCLLMLCDKTGVSLVCWLVVLVVYHLCVSSAGTCAYHFPLQPLSAWPRLVSSVEGSACSGCLVPHCSADCC
jgi:hypothetical protein